MPRTPEQIERRNAARRVANMSPEQHQRERDRARKRWTSLPPDKRKTHKDRMRNLTRIRNFNLTSEQWEEMFDAQGRCCAICKSPEQGTVRSWNTDHCHGGLGVRGILCHGCNIGLGGFKDNIDFLKAAADYLLNHALKVASDIMEGKLCQ